MPTRTGAYLAEQRPTQHLSPQRLAAALGYTNLTKGARRILALERDGHAIDGLLNYIIIVLGLDHDLVHALVARTAGSSKRPGNTGPANPLNRNCAAA